MTSLAPESLDFPGKVVLITGTATAIGRGSSAVEFAGNENTFYDRHLLFDKAANPGTATVRDQFEAFAGSVRDVLAQRWALTTDTYARQNPKMAYYLSMEFLIGRSLANNVTNLLLDGVAQNAISQKDLDWLALLDQEPDPGLLGVNGRVEGVGVLRTSRTVHEGCLDHRYYTREMG